jgi:phosphohistidine phosphatase
MQILIFRHGPAGDREKWAAKGLQDNLRPLTPDGRKKTDQAAAGIARLLPALDVIASSSLVRARQTAACLAKHYKRAKTVELSALKPDAEPAAMLALLKTHQSDETIALVGHDPHLGELAAFLIGGGALELKKAGACLIDLPTPTAGGGRLVWLLRPSQLRALR